MSLCNMASLLLNVKQIGKMNLSCWRHLRQRHVNTMNQGSRRTYSQRLESNKRPLGKGVFGVNDAFHHPSDFEKKIMVFTRIYPSMKDIPKTVSHNAILRAKDRMRIVIAFGMIGFAVIGYTFVMRYSRKLRDEGDGIMKRSMEWQRSLAAERQLKQDAAKTDK